MDKPYENVSSTWSKRELWDGDKTPAKHFVLLPVTAWTFLLWEMLAFPAAGLVTFLVILKELETNS